MLSERPSRCLVHTAEGLLEEGMTCVRNRGASRVMRSGRKADGNAADRPRVRSEAPAEELVGERR